MCDCEAENGEENGNKGKRGESGKAQEKQRNVKMKGYDYTRGNEKGSKERQIKRERLCTVGRPFFSTVCWGEMCCVS